MKREQASKNNKGRKKLAYADGMTMAEMLITVAIIVALMAVAFIGLFTYQRMLAQVERDGIAKEIFIAAQNHLTTAKGEGYLGVAERAKNAATEAEKDRILGFRDEVSGVRYIIVTNGVVAAAEGSTEGAGEDMFEVMLPFGAIEENVRAGSSYIIKYQYKTGTVLDVFYCSTGSGRFDYELTQSDYTTDGSGDEYRRVTSFVDTYKPDGTVEKDNKKNRRDHFRDGKILGWYGGAAGDLESTVLNTPSIEVINGDTLCVRVKDVNSKNSDAKLKLIITGADSKAKKGIELSPTLSGSDERAELYQYTDHDVYIYTLDDITKAGMHFAGLGQDTAGKEFIAGEDIRVEAVAYSLTKLANIELSNEVTENSLYESIADPKDVDNNIAADDGSKYAYVSSIRHLENLEELVSNAGCRNTETAQTAAGTAQKTMTVIKVFQTGNLDWESFTSQRPDTDNAAQLKKGTVGSSADKSVVLHDGTPAGGYYPVSYGSPIIYDGLRHSISKIRTSDTFTGSAGLFGTATSYSEEYSAIQNLRLIDFRITGSDSVGALVGSAVNTKISNVIAYNEIPEGSTHDNPDTATVISSAGDAGGLIGRLSGGIVQYSAAALVVQGSDHAGGFIGKIETGSPSVTACYSGGHTEKGEYYKHKTDGSRDTDIPLKNVLATADSGTAGGFIGDAGSAVISDCYSTCSVWTQTGGLAGGFAGSADGTIKHCYCTGLVGGTESTSDAFIGNGNAVIEKDYFFESINDYKETDSSSTSYKEPGKGKDEAEAVPVDSDEDTYDSFVADEDKWDDAVPYDSVVKDYYRDRYNLMTVTQLRETGKNEEKTRHEQTAKIEDQQYSLFVNTHYGDWPAPEIFFINR